MNAHQYFTIAVIFRIGFISCLFNFYRIETPFCTKTEDNGWIKDEI